jgi:hypothetical protein
MLLLRKCSATTAVLCAQLQLCAPERYKLKYPKLAPNCYRQKHTHGGIMRTPAAHMLLLALCICCIATAEAVKAMPLPPKDAEIDLLAKYTITSRSYKGKLI